MKTEEIKEERVAGTQEEEEGDEFYSGDEGEES